MLWKRAISIVGILLLSSNLYADVSWQKFSYFKNWGGLNDNLSTTEISDSEATDIQNISFDTGGALKKRYGFRTLPTENPQKAATGTTVCVNGLFFYKKDNGNRYLVALCNNDSKATLMKKDYSAGGGTEAGAWENIDNSELNSAYSNDLRPDFAVAQDKLVFVTGDGTSVPYMWNGTDKSVRLTTNANVSSGSVIEYHKNILFITGRNDYPSRVFFSNLDDITTYTATDFLDVETSDGSKVRALKSVYNALYIFKDESIWRLSGSNSDNFTLEKMVDGIGTISNNSVQIVNNIIYFITNQGDIAVYDGGYNVKFVSSKIRNTIGNLNTSRTAQSLGLAFSTYRYNDFDYYASTTTAGSAANNYVLVFDTSLGAWTRFKGMDANAWCVADGENNENKLYFGDYSGYVHRYPSSYYYDGNIASSAISAFYQTKWFKYEESCLGDKYWRLLKTFALSESSSGSTVYLNAECRTDYESSGRVVHINLEGSAANWDVAKWDVDLWGGQVIIVGRSEINKGKNMFQIYFYNNVVNEGFTLLGWENFIEPTSRI